MKEKTKLVIKETFVIVFTGFVITYPLNLGLLYIALEIWDLSVLMTSIFTTAGITLVALVRVFVIRMYYSKDAYSARNRI
jgi:uncharacterized protein (DUF983 family)